MLRDLYALHGAGVIAGLCLQHRCLETDAELPRNGEDHDAQRHPEVSHGHFTGDQTLDNHRNGRNAQRLKDRFADTQDHCLVQLIPFFFLTETKELF